MRKYLRGLAWTVGIIAAVIGISRATFLRWWKVPTDDPALAASMAPNVEAGDILLLIRGKPKLGDLMRCADPDQPGRYVVGRVLAEAGDKIELTNDDVVVNGRKSLREMACQNSSYKMTNPLTGTEVDLYCTIEALQGHKHMRVADNKAPQVTLRRHEVSEGNVFLVSDNRAFPLDSREYGAVPKSSCREMVFFRIVGPKGWGDADSRLTYIR